MLAVAYLFQQGTPFIYQGQEIGMTNIELETIDQYLDVASINVYHSFFKHQSQEKRMHRIHVSSRDSARTPMQWTGGRNAGFSDAEPWFTINPNYLNVNVETEEQDPNSILNFYKKCLRLRKQYEAMLSGSYHEYQAWSGKHYMYERRGREDRFLVICSFSAKSHRYKLPAGYAPEGLEQLLCNYPGSAEIGLLRPYEAHIFRWRN